MYLIYRITLLLFLFSLSTKVLSQYGIRYEKGLTLEIIALNENNERLSAIMDVTFKPKNAHPFDVIKIFIDSNNVVNSLELKKDVLYELVVYKEGYESKLIIVDTKNKSKNIPGYVFPMEIILKEGCNESDILKPIGIIYWDKQSDYYLSKPY